MPRSDRRDRTSSRIWVGWREWVALPALGIDKIKAKIDTGAATSALHAVHVHRLVCEGRDRVAFEVHPQQRSTAHTVRCEAAIRDARWVTSSTGHREFRVVIRTPLLIGPRRYAIDIGLTSRDNMGFRMLLGRRAMKRHLLVDPTGSFLAAPAIASAGHAREVGR